MAKIKMKMSSTIGEVFDDFILSKKAQGLSEKTLAGYRQHFKIVCKFLSADIPIEELSNEDLEMFVVNMRETDLASNSIGSYVRVMKTFLSWCNQKELTTLKLKAYMRYYKGIP